MIPHVIKKEYVSGSLKTDKRISLEKYRGI
jgi:hypothetical protein